MKAKIYLGILWLLVTIAANINCKKQSDDCCANDQQDQVPTVPYYSSVEEFKAGMNRVANLVTSYRVIAYRDTTPNGQPDTSGRKEPLLNDVQKIIAKLNSGQIESAVHDV